MALNGSVGDLWGKLCARMSVGSFWGCSFAIQKHAKTCNYCNNLGGVLLRFKITSADPPLTKRKTENCHVTGWLVPGTVLEVIQLQGDGGMYPTETNHLLMGLCSAQVDGLL